MGVSPDDPRIEQIGFAKLLGEDLELYAKKYEIVIGRKSKSSVVDVVLGDTMSISRQHAKILYKFDRGVWELQVLGKNGVTVQGTLHTPSSPPVVLRSQDLIQIADRSFYFLLPRQQQWVGPKQAEQAARSAEPAASSPVPHQQPPVLPPGSMAAHSMVRQLAASLPLPQQQAMAQVQRAFAQQLVQQQAAAQMHAQLSQAPQAFPVQPALGTWAGQGQIPVGLSGHAARNQARMANVSNEGGEQTGPPDQAQAMQLDGS
ncbi:probable transcriptional activator FHA1 at N-terminal half [Coccomyxa sp. Obi]|nr:probable transcriptional activator FHA1 at N-terminal half [Coccomyxa sp. Obi]